MGIRKGRVLCGVREERCFISHAVSSHPLLELQTLGLSTLSSPHNQDLPLDFIQKKKKKKRKTSHLPLFPPPLPLSFFSFAYLFFSLFSYITCLRCCHHPFFFLLFRSQDLVVAIFLPVTVIFPEMKLKTTKSKVTRFLQTFVVTPLFLLPPFLFFVLQLSHLTTSLWISFLILNMQMI